jgi:hypothetical protein
MGLTASPLGMKFLPRGRASNGKPVRSVPTGRKEPDRRAQGGAGGVGGRARRQIGYTIQNGRVILTAIKKPVAQDDPFACFDEWASEADTKGYASL